MKHKLFTALICLIGIPIISIAQSFKDPLGQINNSVHQTTKDWVFYLMIVALSFTLIIFLIKWKVNSWVAFLGFGGLTLLITWFMM